MPRFRDQRFRISRKIDRKLKELSTLWHRGEHGEGLVAARLAWRERAGPVVTLTAQSAEHTPVPSDAAAVLSRYKL